MSLFSSLTLFYPGNPPEIKVADLRAFCTELRSYLALRDFIPTVHLKYGEKIDQDFDTTNKINWIDESAPVRMGTLAEYPWDHKKSEGEWSKNWPRKQDDYKSIYRAYVGLGGLPASLIHELTAMKSKDTSHEFIAPDMLSFEIDPLRPASLDGRLLECDCYGFVKLSFAGNGFFTWQPLANYWEQIRTLTAFQHVLDETRRVFPVPEMSFFEDVKRDLGELFLNCEDYRQGDWIVSINETG